MLENPLKEVLVKKADLFDTLRGGMSAEAKQSIKQRRAEIEQREALIDKYISTILDPSQPIPDEIKPILQEAIGDRKIDDYKDWNKGFRGWRFGKNGKLIDAYGKRMSSKFDLLGKLKVPTKELTPSVTAEKPSAPAPAETPVQSPLGDTINLDDFADTPSVEEALDIANQGVDGKTIAPAPAAAAAPTPAETPVETPAPAAATKPVETNTPAGLTREETMQFLEQGYVPTSNGGFMLHEQQAANMLKRMQQSPDYNPGQTITDGSRLNRIRNNMLGNQEYTAQGRQQAADDMVYQKAMYHKNRQSEIDARNNAALEQHRGKLVADARTNYLNTGKVDYQRSVLNGAPLTPAAQYYQAYSNAEIDGKPAPALPAQVQNGIAQGMHKFRGQLAAQQKPAAPAPVNPRNPNYYTQQEMDTYAKAHAANNSGQQAVNTVSSWDPNRLKAAQERHNNAISGNNQLVNPLAAGQTNPTPTSTGTTSKQTSAATSK